MTRTLLAVVVALLVGAAPVGAVWQPKPGTTWRWQITGKVVPRGDVQMQDLDLFDARPGQINAGVIGKLHAKGVIAICYIDTGAWESYRPDAKTFPRSVLGGKTYASDGTQWQGERWLDIRKRSWHLFAPLIWKRFDRAKQLGCDGIEPDQNNPYGNKPGFPITKKDQEAWYLEVARQAHLRGLSVGQKNGIETTTAKVVKAFDWNLNEECFQYDECGVLQRYIRAGKAVFSAEYQPYDAAVCRRSRALQFSTLYKHLSLGSWQRSCAT